MSLMKERSVDKPKFESQMREWGLKQGCLMWEEPMENPKTNTNKLYYI